MRANETIRYQRSVWRQNKPRGRLEGFKGDLLVGQMAADRNHELQIEVRNLPSKEGNLS